MKEKKQQPTTLKKSSHKTLDWVEQQLREVKAFDIGLLFNQKSRVQFLVNLHESLVLACKVY